VLETRICQDTDCSIRLKLVIFLVW